MNKRVLFSFKELENKKITNIVFSKKDKHTTEEKNIIGFETEDNCVLFITSSFHDEGQDFDYDGSDTFISPVGPYLFESQFKTPEDFENFGYTTPKEMIEIMTLTKEIKKLSSELDKIKRVIPKEEKEKYLSNTEKIQELKKKKSRLSSDLPKTLNEFPIEETYVDVTQAVFNFIHANPTERTIPIDFEILFINEKEFEGKVTSEEKIEYEVKFEEVEIEIKNYSYENVFDALLSSFTHMNFKNRIMFISEIKQLKKSNSYFENSEPFEAHKFIVKMDICEVPGKNWE